MALTRCVARVTLPQNGNLNLAVKMCFWFGKKGDKSFKKNGDCMGLNEDKGLVMNRGEIILYKTPNEGVEIQLHAFDGTVWLTQKEMAELFNATKSNISMHLKNIFEDGELSQDSVVKESLTTALDGKNYRTFFYNLDAILAVGYRVKSPRGTQFRQWATTTLKEYLVKGFVMNDERLKQADRWDYFDEWLARIRDIRASEKRFYQKIKDIYTTAIDYDKNSEKAQLFFKKVQNKMLWAITGQTAAEIIENHSDPNKPNMGLTSWKGSVPRKSDVAISKNYLMHQEIEKLNHIVTMYLDYAELQAKNRQTITMDQWEEKLDTFLEFNEQELLTHSGKVEAEVAKKLAESRYDKFDKQRKRLEAIKADQEDIKELEDLAHQFREKG